jgi:hypothetical protein
VRARDAWLFLLPLCVLTACDTMRIEGYKTGVTEAKCAEIGQALRAVTLSPVRACYQTADPNTIVVVTKDGRGYYARKIKGTWHFKPNAFLVTQRSNQTLERTADRLETQAYG